MAISLSAIKTAYDNYKNEILGTQTIQAAITALGPYPEFPLAVLADADYNNVVTAQAAWIASYSPLYASLLVQEQTMRDKELLVITAIQTGAGPTQGANEWFKLVGAGGGILTYTDWIGYSNKDVNPNDGLHYLVITTTQPANKFFNSK